MTFNCLFEQFLIDFTYVLRFYETFPETTFLNINYFFLGDALFWFGAILHKIFMQNKFCYLRLG